MNLLSDFYLPKSFKILGLEIAFYAILILFGAFVALGLAAYEARKKGYPIDFFSTIFVIAFPSGIVGARIWYVIAEWNKQFAGGDFLDVFRIWDGGLAIQGGAIVGILAGILYIHFRRKGTKALEIVDFAVPGMLIAQAIGRWGNFFNHEVYGFLVNRDAWGFLPNFVLNQMVANPNNLQMINTPLFLVEGVLNVSAYFFIVHLIKPMLKSHYHYGDNLALYLIFYGIIRALLEPLRAPSYTMGVTVQASFVMAIFFVGAGIFLMLLTRYLPKIIKKYKERLNNPR